MSQAITNNNPMNWIIRKLVKFFFNKWYRIKPPESVGYWRRGDSAKAKIIHADDGSYQMQIEGEKYAYPGYPRGHVLTGPLATLKRKIKNAVFNEVFGEMEKHTTDMLPPERMVPAVRELWNKLEVLENAEVVEDMKARIRLIKKVLCFFLQEDDAYRFRWQWVMEHMDMGKIRMTKADKYYFRGKYFKVDHDRFDY